MEGGSENRTRIAALLLAGALAAPTGAAAAWPDPPGAAAAAIDMPLRAGGSAIGGVGLIGAALVALAGDALPAIDPNRWTEPRLRGAASGVVHRGALLVSTVSTSALEALRAEDIERLPEAQAAYLSAAPGVGRMDTALTGGAALRLAAGDLLAWPALVVLRLAGAAKTADRLSASRLDARIAALGPSPLPPGAPVAP